MAGPASFNAAALAGRVVRLALKSLPKGMPRSAISNPKRNAALGKSAVDPDEVTRLLNLLQASKGLRTAPRIAGRASPIAAAQSGPNAR